MTPGSSGSVHWFSPLKPYVHWAVDYGVCVLLLCNWKCVLFQDLWLDILGSVVEGGYNFWIMLGKHLNGHVCKIAWELTFVLFSFNAVLHTLSVFNSIQWVFRRLHRRTVHYRWVCRQHLWLAVWPLWWDRWQTRRVQNIKLQNERYMLQWTLGQMVIVTQIKLQYCIIILVAILYYWIEFCLTQTEPHCI